MQPYDSEDRDSLFNEAVSLVIEAKMASSSLIQRRLKLGYARAARLIDQLEKYGVISSSPGAKPRQVLVTSKNVDEVIRKSIKKIIIEPEPMDSVIRWKKLTEFSKKSKNFEIDIGVDEQNKLINFNLEHYGNLLIIGSQYTSINNLLNNILATSMAIYSPEELRILVFDGTKGELISPNKTSHLLTPLIIEPEKAISALKWSNVEIERRIKFGKNINYPKILILINSLNQFINISPSEVSESIYNIITLGKQSGIYIVIGTDYVNSKYYDGIIANNPAKIVFKPTDIKVIKKIKISKLINLESPDQAILKIIFKEDKKISINKINPKTIYSKIFS